ncbi:MAG: hypothetical protein AAGA90_01835 [Actinomycetota bacterium]
MHMTLTALVALALVVSACGGDDDDVATTAIVEVASDVASSAEDAEPATTTTTEAPAATTTTTEAPATTAPVEDASQAAGSSLYDFRYCEILISVPAEGGGEVTEVWGTPGVDPCTDEAWYALDPATIQAENDASFIEMNGPLYFIVDGTAETGDGSGGTGTAAGGEAVTRQFGDITMNLLATAEVGEASEEYAPDLVVRTTTWTYQAGTEVFELTDPEGNVYTMQSYSRIVDTDLTAADLPTLGDQLDLPVGWSYSSRVLDAPLQVELSPDGAIVVQDDLRNAYQRNG